jgi:imidazole glycerol-phosphate synthase subunit HisH
MIAVIDYGMGNLRSVQKGLERSGFTAEITRDRQRIATADGVVLPGVGAFHACMENLRSFGLVGVVQDVVRRQVPFLGICLGLQLLFDESEEFGRQSGLGLIPGKVAGFPLHNGLKVPHMGWNSIQIKKKTRFLEGVHEAAEVYFVHSYFVVPQDESCVATVTSYGEPFVSSIATDSLFACQFHPEKSQALGLRILENFGNFTTKP